MNNFNILLLITTIFAFLFTLSPVSHAVDKFHSYEQYKATYKLEGVKSGEKIFCSRNWGNEKVQIEHVTIQKQGEEPKKLNQKVITKIVDGQQWIYSINLDENAGTKTKNPNFPELAKSMEGKDPAEFAKSILKQIGGEVVGQKKILGRSCDVWKVSVIETCVSEKGIALQTISEQPEISETIESIDTDSTCKSDVFDVGSAKLKEVDLQKKN